MSSGLLALLDDVAAIAKMAAASLDDAASQVGAASGKAIGKAAGIVIDDTAVTPRYVVGFAANRELPIIGRIAWGSIKNKLLFLLPGALILSVVAPWAIMPLLMAGGAFLCFEGYEKVHEMVAPHHGDQAGTEATAATAAAQTPEQLKAMEDERVSGAIRTDLILSAEIMAIALATVANAPFVTKAIALFVVALLVTGAVYGLVALIVKADDAGVVMARQKNGLVAAIGRGLVTGMPPFLKGLSIVGTVAMLWVGGGIVIHGLHEMGFVWPEKTSHAIAHAIGGGLAPLSTGLAAFTEWLVAATIAGVAGLGLGWLTERLVHALKDRLPAAPRFSDF